MKFEEPAGNRGRPQGASAGVWEKRLARLKKSPKKWARVWEATSSAIAADSARNIRSGRVKLSGRFDAQSRTVTVANGTKRYYVYAMYLGRK